MVDRNPPAYPVSHQERFPIELTSAPDTLNIYPVEYAALDAEQKGLVADYAKGFRKESRSVMTVAVPGEAPGGAISKPMADMTRAILATLAANGVPTSAIRGETYAPENQSKLNPVKLSYIKPQLDVRGQCGLWTDDLGFASFEVDVQNLPYYNHGCATQRAIARQIANPTDYVRAQKVMPTDGTRAQNVIGRYRRREGSDFVAKEAGPSNGGGAE